MHVGALQETNTTLFLWNSGYKSENDKASHIFYYLLLWCSMMIKSVSTTRLYTLNYILSRVLSMETSRHLTVSSFPPGSVIHGLQYTTCPFHAIFEQHLPVFQIKWNILEACDKKRRHVGVSHKITINTISLDIDQTFKYKQLMCRLSSDCAIQQECTVTDRQESRITVHYKTRRATNTEQLFQVLLQLLQVQ
jgi:hypothetical protein